MTEVQEPSEQRSTRGTSMSKPVSQTPWNSVACCTDLHVWTWQGFRCRDNMLHSKASVQIHPNIIWQHLLLFPNSLVSLSPAQKRFVCLLTLSIREISRCHRCLQNSTSLKPAPQDRDNYSCMYIFFLLSPFSPHPIPLKQWKQVRTHHTRICQCPLKLSTRNNLMQGFYTWNNGHFIFKWLK